MSRNVITIGTFDLFHAGHVALIKQCLETAGTGQILVGLNSDEFIKNYKGRPPICTYDERFAVLSSLMIVDHVVKNCQGNVGESIAPILENPFMRNTPRPMLFDTIVIGDDWKDRDYLGQIGVTQEWLDERDITIEYIPRVLDLSTSQIKRRVIEEEDGYRAFGDRPDA